MQPCTSVACAFMVASYRTFAQNPFWPALGRKRPKDLSWWQAWAPERVRLSQQQPPPTQFCRVGMNESGSWKLPFFGRVIARTGRSEDGRPKAHIFRLRSHFTKPQGLCWSRVAVRCDFLRCHLRKSPIRGVFVRRGGGSKPDGFCSTQLCSLVLQPLALQLPIKSS